MNDLADAAMPVELLELRAELAQLGQRVSLLAERMERDRGEALGRWLVIKRAYHWHRIATLATDAASCEASGRSLERLGTWPETRNRLASIRASLTQLEAELVDDGGTP